MWGEPQEAEIVGVVDNVLKDGNDRQPQPEMYVPMALRDRLGTDVLVVVRTERRSAGLPRLVAEHVRGLAPHATTEIMPLAERLSLSVARPRFAALVLAGFALVSLLLATAGLYGAVSFAVTRRRHELGVRSALGASRVALVRLVLRDGLRVTGIGLALGGHGGGARRHAAARGPPVRHRAARPRDVRGRPRSARGRRVRGLPAPRPARHRRRAGARAPLRMTR